MDVDEYFEVLSKDFRKAFAVAEAARSKGLDPRDTVEIKEAPDLASRVEGIISVDGIRDLIKSRMNGQPNPKLAFDVIEEICTNDKYAGYEKIKRIEFAVRVGLSILTDGVQVAPTEGLQGIGHFKNDDNTDYISVIYAGPIRGAGGTASALSVALADYARKFFDVGEFKPTENEVERYVEEAEIYDSRCARLQYKPSDDDLRTIVKNCPVCIDGLPTEKIEVSVHREMQRVEFDGKKTPLTNRVRGGMPLVLCEGVAQKAKKVMKIVKSVGLDWSWLNQVIKVNKSPDASAKSKTGKKSSVFLEELVAGRPVFAYPGRRGGFRLRYGRSRLTGIAAKGVTPATMIVSNDFIATGMQLKVEFPGKGCIAVPVDTIEGPFVKLKSGECLRVNSAEKANEVKPELEEILYLGDMLITLGDFKKSNSILQPSSYVEEIWKLELRAAGYDDSKLDVDAIQFKEAMELSSKYGVAMHPRFLYEFPAIDASALQSILKAVKESSNLKDHSDLWSLQSLQIKDSTIKRSLEVLAVPHTKNGDVLQIEGDTARSLLASLGFADKTGKLCESNPRIAEDGDVLQILNAVSPFKLKNRSTFIGGRAGRPEKARERLMKPAPQVLFPIAGFGGKERSITKAYMVAAKKFGGTAFKVNIAKYVCRKCKRVLDLPYCYDCQLPAIVERECRTCHTVTSELTCPKCNGKTYADMERDLDIVKAVNNVMNRLQITNLPHIIKGVKGMTSRDKNIEPLEKGVLRSRHGIFIFKDGTSRFDSTDATITHFYPVEIGTPVEKLRELGYTKDYLGNELERDDQLIELNHQDIIVNTRGGEYLLKVAKFMDDMLENLYGLERFYNVQSAKDLIGHLAITQSPHTSAGVLCRIIGFTTSNIGLAHPYVVCARRRNCDGDEDTTMLLLDALINFSKSYLPTTIGGTMDAPLVLMLHVYPEEVDDEVHEMEVASELPLEFYEKTYQYLPPGDAAPLVEAVSDRLKDKSRFSNIMFTHGSSKDCLLVSPRKSMYTTLKTMKEKIDAEFALMDMLDAVDKSDAARKLIVSHFIPDLIGNLHSFSQQIFRCVVCNAKYRRIPLSGKCMRDGGKLLLTISKGGIVKYLKIARDLGEKYSVDPYIRQRLDLVKTDIEELFGTGDGKDTRQFDLSKFM